MRLADSGPIHSSQLCRNSLHILNGTAVLQHAAEKGQSSHCKAQCHKIMWELFIHKEMDSCCNSVFGLYSLVEAPLLAMVHGMYKGCEELMVTKHH